MENKLMDKTVQHIGYAVITQRNKRNFSTITSRVSASQRKRNCRCRNLGKKGSSTDMKVQWRSPPDDCCHHNSHDDTTDETVTTWLADHRPSHQLKESLHTASRITERLSREIRRGTDRQYNSFMNECLRGLHTSFTREDDVCWHWQLCLDWLNQTKRSDIVCPAQTAQGHLPTVRNVRAVKRDCRRQDRDQKLRDRDRDQSIQLRVKVK